VLRAFSSLKLKLFTPQNLRDRRSVPHSRSDPWLTGRRKLPVGSHRVVERLQMHCPILSLPLCSFCPTLYASLDICTYE